MIQKLHLINFRNYGELTLDIPPAGAFLCGPNGSGKTNILEAIHLLCTVRSQRGALKAEMIKADADYAFLEGIFSDPDQEGAPKAFAFSFDRSGASKMAINDTKLDSITDWFGSRAVVSFATSDIDLVYGSPEGRRRFLDILISLSDPEYLHALVSYRKNLALRNKMLKLPDDPALCGIYETNMAEAGAVVVEKREKMVAELLNSGALIHEEISGKKERFSVVYEPGVQHDFIGKNEWKNVFFTMLSERRKHDRETGFSSLGPHRDDIRFLIDNKAAKNFASQGQCRSFVLTLKLGSMLCLEKKSHQKIIILFDDAVSELDPSRTARVYSVLENRGQLFVASPSGNPPLAGLRSFGVAGGAVSAV